MRRSRSTDTGRQPSPRILILTPYAFRGSGVWTFVTNLQKELETSLLETSLLPFTPRRLPPFLKSAQVGIDTFINIWRRRGSVDIIHCQQLYLQSLVACVLGRILGKGTLITIHGLPPRSRGLRGVVLRIIEQVSLKVCHTVVCVADSLKKQIGTGIVILNGVRVTDIRSAMLPRNEVRASLGIGDDFVAVFAGRITLDKGCIVLLDAAESIFKSRAVPLCLLLIGPLEQRIQPDLRDRFKRSGGRVKYMGEQDEPWRFYAAADVFLLPSFREGMPMGLLEAMATGLPVVATPVGDIPQVIVEGQTGWLVPVGDSTALGEAIVAASVSTQRKAMGKEAARIAEAHFDFSATARRYLSIYYHLAGSLSR